MIARKKMQKQVFRILKMAADGNVVLADVNKFRIKITHHMQEN